MMNKSYRYLIEINWNGMEWIELVDCRHENCWQIGLLNFETDLQGGNQNPNQFKVQLLHLQQCSAKHCKTTLSTTCGDSGSHCLSLMLPRKTNTGITPGGMVWKENAWYPEVGTSSISSSKNIHRYPSPLPGNSPRIKAEPICEVTLN